MPLGVNDVEGKPMSERIQQSGQAAVAEPSGQVWIEGGTFTMGSDHHYPEEAPAHPVRVADGGGPHRPG